MKLIICAICVIHIFAYASDCKAKEKSSKELITEYWQAQTTAQQKNAGQKLKLKAKDSNTLYQWLKEGPHYSSDVTAGHHQKIRENSRGVKLPYIYIVPDNYDPNISYPVEFNLHGGIGRKKTFGSKWWLKGTLYNHYKNKQQISVFPAAWKTAPWWGKEQAENLPQILQDLKRQYNIDDNKVFMSGISDGGSGTFFFAFMQPTEWAAFLPFIGHPAVISNSDIGERHKLEMENLSNSKLYIVSGEKDRLYPSRVMRPYIDAMENVKMDYTFVSVENGKHNMKWFSKLSDQIDQYKNGILRDPIPDKLRWVAHSSSIYNQISWLSIDKLKDSKQSAWISIALKENTYVALTEGITSFSIMLNPEEIDLLKDVQVIVNSKEVFFGLVKPNMDTLLQSASRLDKSQLYVAKLSVNIE